jgi:hypothetical protein
MSKLCQIIAVCNGTKGRTQKALTEAHHKVQKDELLSGISRTYRPKDEEGDQLPPESKHVRFKVSDAISQATKALSELFAIVETQDRANTEAQADVVVDGEVLRGQVPVTHLLFLEKQLVDLRTFIGKLPVLDSAEEWEYSPATGCYATPVHQTSRTKKVPRNHVKAEATKEHPAQVEMYTEDVIVGIWDTTKFSGAIPADERQGAIDRCEKLIDAVKMARELANSREVIDVEPHTAIFDYIFKGTSASSA